MNLFVVVVVANLSIFNVHTINYHIPTFFKPLWRCHVSSQIKTFMSPNAQLLIFFLVGMISIAFDLFFWVNLQGVWLSCSSFHKSAIHAMWSSIKRIWTLLTIVSFFFYRFTVPKFSSSSFILLLIVVFCCLQSSWSNDVPN